MFCRVKDITAYMEGRFPLQLCEEWDNSGLQVGSSGREVRLCIVTLDVDEAVIEEAEKLQASMIISHHPLIFKAMKSIDIDRGAGRLIARLIKSDIAVYSAHTNLDAAEGGMNDWLAECLGLTQVASLADNPGLKLYKLVVYVPVGHEEALRHAITGAGAGHIGRYSGCSFRVQGTGTFMAGEGANPYLGTPGVLEEAREYRLETIVDSVRLSSVLAALQANHPYEEPAYDIIPLANSYSGGTGRIGWLPEPTSLPQFCALVQERLGVRQLRMVGREGDMVEKVAVVGGSGASYIRQAAARGADVLLTGDIKYHEARDAMDMGLKIVDAGHYGTEAIMIGRLTEELNGFCEKHGWKTVFYPLSSMYNCDILS